MRCMRTRQRRQSLCAIAVAFAALAVVVAGLLTGCGGASDVQVSPTADQPVKGGTLRVGMESEPGTLDPSREWSFVGMTIERSLFDTLVTFKRVEGDSGLEIVPDLASSLPTVSKDGLHYVFDLRQDIKFAPPVNRACTARDFKASFERMMRQPDAPVSYYTAIMGAQAYVDGKASHIEGITARDFRVRIDLEHPNPELLMALCVPFTAVVPVEYYEQEGTKAGRNPVGTGPFVLSGWKSGQGIQLERNPNYAGQFPVYVDGIDISFVSASTGVLRVETGELDVIGDLIPAPEVVRLSNDPDWKEQLTLASSIGLFFMFMDTKVEPFDNPGVRRAIMWAINREKLVKLQAGVGKNIDQFLPPGLAGYQQGLGAPYTAYDPEKAKQLLSQAGYPDGFETTLTVWNQSPLPMLMQSIQSDLKSIGIKVNIRVLDQAAYFGLVGDPGKIALGIMGWVADFPDPSNFLIPLFTKSGIGGYNGSFWWSQKTDDLVTQAQSTVEPAARAKLYVEVQRSILEEAPAVPLWQTGVSYLVGKEVGGFYVHPVILLDMPSYWKR